jgi:MYXO-CTERM domain-containing protein
MTSSGTLTSLISFTGANGQYPECQLVEGIDGNFYGTTKSGGSANDGTVFSISPLGAFNSLASFSGTNGANPTSGLVLGTDGNFYGTTSAGGGVFNDGTIFKVTSAGTLTSLVSFTGLNGAQPLAVLVQGTDGNFYGTTNSGSSLGDGSVFRVTPAGVLTTLAAFNGANGDQPDGRVIQGSDGNLYGTTEFGGTSDAGVIFQLIKPSQVAAPSFSLAAGTFTSAQTVAMTTATSGALIVYTANGTTPAESGGFITNGKLYSTPVTISATTTINAIAFESGMDSPITTVTYTIGTPVTATPAPPASGGGGGGAPSYWFLAFLAAAGLLRWRFRQAQAI